MQEEATRAATELEDDTSQGEIYEMSLTREGTGRAEETNEGTIRAPFGQPQTRNPQCSL